VISIALEQLSIVATKQHKDLEKRVMGGMVRNRVKATLATGGVALGTLIGAVRTPALIRLIAAAGYDFVIIDLEHGALSNESVTDMCEMARATGLVPLIRPPGRDVSIVSQLLGLGPMGLMYPGVTSRSEVDLALRWNLFPPHGERSGYPGAITDYHLKLGPAETSFINENFLTVIQIESLEGIEHIAEILDGGGVDVVQVGRSDLAASYGVTGQRRHPKVLTAVDSVLKECRKRDVAVGIGCESREEARDFIDRGAAMIIYPTSEFGLLMRAYREAVETLRPPAEDVSAQ
jgi:2-keto-3-deoxy-L-rhamnonate aldolase RhmA